MRRGASSEHPSSGVDLAGVSALADTWRRRWPSPAQQGAGAYLDIISGREILLRALAGEAARRKSALPHEVWGTIS